jgi:peroxiredoxin
LQNGNGNQNFGEPLGDFSLRDISGNTVSLSAELEGKQGGVVVFWSSICSHCVRYGKYLGDFEAQHPELRLFVVASRHGETVADIKKAVSEQNLRFRILHDPGGRVAKEWHTQQTPRVFLMDGCRRLIYRGAIDNYQYPDNPQYVNHLEPAIAQFEAGQPIAKPETASFGCAIQSVYYILPKAL